MEQLMNELDELMKQVNEKTEEIINKAEELNSELDRWQEKYEDLENDLKENYNPKSKYEIYGIRERDFH